ncbi:hypothetical protein D3C76_191120 [compost metagenome]
MTGISIEKFADIAKQNEKPEKIKKTKTRKEKPPLPVRKLKNPEIFTILSNNGIKPTTGEKVFTYNGFDFWIRHNGHYWIVSDATSGTYIYAHERYKKAIADARDRIERHFDKYIAGLQIIKDRAHEEAMSKGGIRDENLWRNKKNSYR